MITEWWTGLSLIMKLLWGMTLTASLIFIIQTIMTFIGADGMDTDLDSFSGNDFDTGPDLSDMDGNSGMNLYTFRNFINFLLGFGWTAILLQEKIRSTAILILLSVVVGVLLVTLVMYIFKWLNSMQQSGNINIYKSAVGCKGQVYLTIPSERQGAGKIQISINNSIREYDAVTDGNTIKTGTSIKVTEVINENTLLVEELNSLII